MNVLIACEESQRVTSAFRDKGHNAFSCDILDCSGGHPEWHIKADIWTLLIANTDSNPTTFITCDSLKHKFYFIPVIVGLSLNLWVNPTN